MDPSSINEFDPLMFNREVRLESNFVELVHEIEKEDIRIPSNPVIVSGQELIERESGDYTLTLLEELKDGYKLLDPVAGCEIVSSKSTLIAAYDESISFYSMLEGKLAYVSHSLLFMYNGQYYPLNQLSLVFCTASYPLHKKIKGSLIADKWDVDTTVNVEIAKQKGHFIVDNCFKDTILLIDGPLIAGDGLAYFMSKVKKLEENNIIPVFLVKNSLSSSVVNCFKELKGQYNSDLHYTNEILIEGSRSPFYQYTNKDSKDKTKVFCYVKHEDHHSPLRVEFPTSVFNKNRMEIEHIMDMIYYLIKVQGNPYNPQVRPVAVAEMFARETMKLVNVNKDVIKMKLTPSMNEDRGMPE